MGFLKKIFQGKQAILGPKMAHHYKFGFTLRIFCTMKGVKRYTEIILEVFHLQQMTYFTLKNDVYS